MISSSLLGSQIHFANIEREELLRALGLVIDGLLSETEEVRELAAKVESQLRELNKETLA